MFLEFRDEANSFLIHCKNQNILPESFHIIALQPEAQVFFKKLGIPYENTLPYFPNQSHRRALLKSDEWYKVLTDELNLEDGTEIKETYNNTFLFYLRLYIHHFLMYVEILSNVCNKFEVKSIHACLYQNKIRLNDRPLIQDNERYLGLMAKKFAKNQGIIWQEIPAISKSKVTHNSVPFLNAFKGTLEKIISVLYKFLILNLNDKNKKVILLMSTGYNIESLSEKLKTNFSDTRWIAVSREKPSRAALKFIYFRILKILRKPKGCSIEPIPLGSFALISEQNTKNRQMLEKNLDKAVEKLQKQASYFEYDGVNFVEVFLEKVQKDLKPYVSSFHSDSVALGEVIGSFNVKLCVSPVARETALLAGELCRNKEIPTLMVSHGTLKIPENEMEEIEYYHTGETLVFSEFFNYVAVQTPNEEKVCRHYKRGNIIKTGPLIFSKPDIRRREKYKKSIVGDVGNKVKVLIYPENTKTRSGIRFHVFETFDEFLSSASDLVDTVNEIENVHLVIRLHPGRKMEPVEFKSLLPPSNKLTVTSFERPFFETLTIADLVLTFSSTVVEDALQSYIPVLLYDKRNRYMHFEAERVGINESSKPNAVYYINSSEHLKNGIEWILNNHLNRNVHTSIFHEYVFQEDYFNNLVDFFNNKI